MATPAEPLLIYNRLADVLECARAALAELGALDPPLELGAESTYPGKVHPGVTGLRVAVQPGQPAFDDLCSGYLYAYSEGAPSLNDGTFTEYTATPPVCQDAPALGMRIVVGVVRCVPTMDDTGKGPTDAQHDAAARLIYADQLAVWRAVVCCLVGLGDDTGRWRTGESTLFVPQSGLGGSEVRAVLSLEGALAGSAAP